MTEIHRESFDSRNTDDSIKVLELRVEQLKRQLNSPRPKRRLENKKTARSKSQCRKTKKSKRITNFSPLNTRPSVQKKENSFSKTIKPPHRSTKTQIFSLFKPTVKSTQFKPKNYDNWEEMLKRIQDKFSPSIRRKKRRERANSEGKAPDWADSELDRYAKTRIFEFNWEGNEMFLTEEEIRHPKFLKSLNQEKVWKTLEKLGIELKIEMNIDRNDVKKMIRECEEMLDFRELTIKTLYFIEEREKILKGGDFRKARLVSEEIVSLIGNWKALKNPFNTFIYEGKDVEYEFSKDAFSVAKK